MPVHRASIKGESFEFFYNFVSPDVGIRGKENTPTSQSQEIDNTIETTQTAKTLLSNETWKVPEPVSNTLIRTPRRACKDIALARLLTPTVSCHTFENHSTGRRPSNRLSQRPASGLTSHSRPARSTLTPRRGLDSPPISRLRSLTISDKRTSIRKALSSHSIPSKRTTSEYRPKRINHVNSDDDDDDAEMVSDDSDSTSTSDSDTTSEDDSSESDSSFDWTRSREKRRNMTARKAPIKRPETMSASRAIKTPGSFLPRRRLSVQPNRHTMTQSLKSHVSGECLPGREHEFDSIYTFISGKLLDNDGGCMYISGLPGTGKTASVMAVISAMSGASKGGQEAFKLIMVNGMQVNDPAQVYGRIYQLLSGRVVSAKQAAQQLEREFCSATLASRNAKLPRAIPVVLVIDELDLLCTRRQDVLYNLFDWPTRPRGSRALIVLAIANTMDLPERLLHPRVASRLGLTRLQFAPYSHEQLVQIVQTRLSDNAFQAKALELAARKVSAVSGDVRRALDICRRAAELAAIQAKPTKQVQLEHINVAIREMFTTPKLHAIRACSLYEKLFLRGLVAEFQARSTEEARLDRCLLQMCALCRLEGNPCPTTSEVFEICSSLGAHKLLLCEASRRDTSMLVRLNCSKADVLFALKPDRAGA